jgi:hypothetical protein
VEIETSLTFYGSRVRLLSWVSCPLPMACLGNEISFW